MAKGHRSQIKRERNAQKDTRPSAKLSYARVSVQKACFVLDAIRGKDVQTALGIVTYNPRYASSLIKKLLESAIANAENNNNMDPAKLYVEPNSDSYQTVTFTDPEEIKALGDITRNERMLYYDPMYEEDDLTVEVTVSDKTGKAEQEDDMENTYSSFFKKGEVPQIVKDRMGF